MLNWLARFLGRPTETEFAEEVRSHLAHEIDEQVDRGLPPEEARYAALRRFGNVTRHLERFREASPAFWLETLWQDVRTGWRSLCRTPVLSAVAILSLGLGIGANTSIYTVARAVLLDPMRVPDADRMFVIRAENHPLSFMPGVTPAELDDIVQLAGTLGPRGPTSSGHRPTGERRDDQRVFSIRQQGGYGGVRGSAAPRPLADGRGVSVGGPRRCADGSAVATAGGGCQHFGQPNAPSGPPELRTS